MTNITQRVESLRAKMEKYNIKAYIIPSSDPHQSEYAADRWLSRAWISNFTGSAGTAMVALDHAGLWTDVRYFLQANRELADTPFELHKMENQASESYTQWLCNNLNEGDIVGIDGYNFSINQVSSLEKALNKKGIILKANVDFISQIWEDDRPPLPKAPIFIHDSNYLDVSIQDKLSQVKQNTEADYTLLSALDDIAWTLNLRGSDVDFNPVFIAYLLIGDETTLYVDQSKLPTQVKTYLADANVKTQEYTDIIKTLAKLGNATSISVDPSICSHSLANHITGSIVQETSQARLLKAIKTDKEVRHIRQAMIKDAVALTKGFMWLEQTVASGKVSEYDFAMKLAEYRSQQKAYYGESFPAIIGYNGNGAYMHYRPHPETSAILAPSGVLLADSGGQYQDGTTDITRTIAMGDDVSDETKKAFTLVLKGMIALDVAKFPVGTYGGQLDTFARQHLWSAGLNYGHGTGHGVGYFMNVHEPPQGFTAGPSSRANTIMKPGMITSNEPGYYKENEYGIRIENIVVTLKGDHDGYLKHESVTLFPIDRKMMQLDLLTQGEIDWLNHYHQRTYDEVSPYLDPTEQKWLKKQCSKL